MDRARQGRTHIGRHMPAAGGAKRGVEQRIATIAAAQHGVVTRAQLLAAGLSEDAVDRRLKRGWLRPLQRGVFVVGPLIAPRAAEMAAALACGEGAVVSHRSAASLWQLLPHVGAPGPLHVTVTRGHPCARTNVRIHRVRTLRSEEVTRHEGIPVTTPVRTLYDLASTAAGRDVECALDRALAQRLTSAPQVLELLAHHGGRRGARRLRDVLDSGTTAPTWSAAERRFLRLLRRVELPRPEVNVTVEGYRVDFFWPAERLIVEIDGFAFHSSRATFENDRRRDAVLAAAGVRVLRVTWRQIVNEPAAVLVRLAQALARTGQTGSRLRATKARFAGRSARRRTNQGNHSGP